MSELKNLNILEKEFTEDQYTRGIELYLEGELLFEDAHNIMRKIPELVRDHGKKIVLNMKNLEYIDSSGLGAILFVSEALRMQGQSLEIRNANPYNMKVLKTIHRVGTFKLVDPESGLNEKVDE